MIHDNTQSFPGISDLVAELKLLTNLNDHGGACLLIAKALGRDDLAERFHRINRQQLHLGHLTHELGFARDEACRVLRQHAKNSLCNTDYVLLRRFIGGACVPDDDPVMEASKKTSRGRVKLV